MIYLGADHGGFELKEKIKHWLTEWGHAFTDCGATVLDPEDDYPDFAFAVADQVGMNDNQTLLWKDRDKGILLCRSAAGMIIAANKVVNVRAVATFDEQSVTHARQHNDANIIGLSGSWLDDQKAKKMVQLFLETEFSREARHGRRLDKIAGRELWGGGGGCCGGQGGCGGGCHD